MRLLLITFYCFQICRIFSTVVTSLLPGSVYLFCKTLFSCRLLAICACALSATQLHLTVLGAHSLVNSFTAPLLFLGLSCCLPNTYLSQSSRRYSQTEKNGDGIDDNSDASSECSSESYGDRLSSPNLRQRRTGSNMDGNNNNNHNRKTNGHEISTKSIPIALEGPACDNQKWYVLVASAFILGLVCYIRPDTAILCITLYIAYWLMWRADIRTRTEHFMRVVLGGTCAIAVGVMTDWRHYGFPVTSPVQWFKFNVMSAGAATLFSSNRPTSYLSPFISDYFHSLSSVVCCIHCTIYVFDQILMRNKCKTIAPLLVSIVVNCIIFSLVSHKEMRFIHNIFVLFTILISVSVHDILCELTMGKSKSTMRYCMLGLVMLCAGNTWRVYPNVNDGTTAPWTYGTASDSRDLNVCLNVLSRQSNVTGVFIDGDIYDIGGLTVLNHNVPVIVKMYHEYCLYKVSKDNNYGISRALRILNHPDDIFHASNKQYSVMMLTKDDTFNFVLMKNLLPVLKRAYKPVIRCGQYFLYGRQDGIKFKIQSRDWHPQNATVAVYETSLLVANGLYDKAIGRLRDVVDLQGTDGGPAGRRVSDRDLVKAYQLLMTSYYQLGQTNKGEEVRVACFQRYGPTACMTPQPKIVLHPEYERYS